MRRAFFALLLVVAGCSDPTASRLQPGQEVMTFSQKAETKQFVVENGDSYWLNVGSKVRVVQDEDPADHAYRKVAVLVVEGPNQGKPATLARIDLRPLK